MKVYVLYISEAYEGCSPPYAVISDEEVAKAWSDQKRDPFGTHYHYEEFEIDDLKNIDKRTKFGKWLEKRGKE